MGVLWVLIAAVLWGTLGVAAKPALDAGASGFVMALGRALLVGVVYLVYRRGLPLAPSIIALSLLGVTPMYVSYMYSVECNGIGVASVMLYTAPLWTTILVAPILLNEKPGRAEVMLGLISVTGVYLLYGSIPASILCMASGLLSGISYSIVIALSRKIVLKGYTLLDAALAPITLSIPFIIFFTLLSHNTQIGEFPVTLFSSAYMGTVTGIAYLSYVKGLKHIKASKASVIATLEPLTAMILDMAVYHSSYTIGQFLGSILIIGSVTVSIFIDKK